MIGAIPAAAAKAALAFEAAETELAFSFDNEIEECQAWAIWAALTLRDLFEADWRSWELLVGVSFDGWSGMYYRDGGAS